MGGLWAPQCVEWIAVEGNCVIPAQHRALEGKEIQALLLT